jgi:type I restriction enzyme R subunit
VDRTIDGFEGLEAAQNCIDSNEKRDAFAADFSYLNKLWEALSPAECINPYQTDYRWLAGVYQSVKPPIDTVGKLLWHSLGAKTTELIHKNVHVGQVSDDLEEYILDADVIDDIAKSGNSKKLIKILKGRLKGHPGDPIFKDLSERLEQLRDKAEKGLIMSIEFVKELCKLAKETVEAEKEKMNQAEQQNAKAALTELFLETKTDQTPAVVERIVNDIDQIVKLVRFDGWQTTAAGEREVQKSLRKALLKYKLHKDQALFDRAYAYIKEYY